MDVKETLKKLHEKLPLLCLDELFDVLDCYVETSVLKYDQLWSSTDIKIKNPYQQYVTRTNGTSTT